MILCVHRTSRSSEQNTKRRSLSERMWTVCIFNSQDCIIIKLGRYILGEIQEMAKVCGLFFPWLCFLGAVWLSRQTVLTSRTGARPPTCLYSFYSLYTCLPLLIPFVVHVPTSTHSIRCTRAYLYSFYSSYTCLPLLILFVVHVPTSTHSIRCTRAYLYSFYSSYTCLPLLILFVVHVPTSTHSIRCTRA